MDLLAELLDARKQRMLWRNVADHLLRLEASASLAPDGQPWIRAVEAVSGYSANHLRRMSRAFSVLDEMQRFCPEHADRISRLTYSHAEILARFWEADRAQVQKLLRDDGWLTYSQLLSRYEEARSRRAAPNAAGKLAVGRFRADIGRLLHCRYGPELRDPAPFHPYAKPDFLVIGEDNVVSAWDCLLLPGRIHEEALRRRFLAWATESTFVTFFWIVVQHDQADEIIKRLIDELQLANVGLTAPAGATLHPVLAPRGSPLPDRTRGLINRSYW